MTAILPKASDIVAPAIAQLIALRPKTFPSLNYGFGNYALIFAGLKAQAELAISGLASGVVAHNLATARGNDLRDYATSEYEMLPTTGATTGVGNVTLDRSGSPDVLVQGTIPKGFKFHRDAQPNGTVALGAADYVSSIAVQFAYGQTTASVPIECTTTGETGNKPTLLTNNFGLIEMSDAPFDTNLSVQYYACAGGSSPADDDDIERYARAAAVGEDGPTDAALALAVLGASGVRKYLVTSGAAYVADGSWATSIQWTKAIGAYVANTGLMGYAARFSVNPLTSVPVAVSLTVRLRDSDSLNDTNALYESCVAAVSSYLDDRTDFNVFSEDALRAVVTVCDPAVLRCTDASITNLDGTDLSANSGDIVHLLLTNGACTINFLGPF